MNLYEHCLRRLARRPWVALVGRYLVTPVDRFLRARTDGRLGLTGRVPTLLLTTTGRRTGRPRTTPLFYRHDGDRLAIVATNFGRPNHPAWSANLLASPDARVRLDREDRAYRARLATAAEETRLWPAFDAHWPAYASYRARCRRDVRMFILEPRRFAP
jgi:deazaflavin-dependent oxidoreductase (nitroreductase family)